MKHTKVICFANNKGGSGKSTSCSNIGFALTLLGRSVLMVDGDMQMNLTLSFFGEKDSLRMADGQKNIYYALKNQQDLSMFVVSTSYENLDLIPSSILMSGIEYDLFHQSKREFTLKECLDTIRKSEEYDYILIDAPPTLGGWTTNILCAADSVIIPVEASPWGLFGLANLLEYIQDIRQFNKELDIMGIAVTKADIRKSYFKQTIDTLNAAEGIHLFESFIRVDSAVEWAQDNNQPVTAYKRSSRSSNEYMKLAKEVDEIGFRQR